MCWVFDFWDYLITQKHASSINICRLANHNSQTTNKFCSKVFIKGGVWWFRMFGLLESPCCPDIPPLFILPNHAFSLCSVQFSFQFLNSFFHTQVLPIYALILLVYTLFLWVDTPESLSLHPSSPNGHPSCYHSCYRRGVSTRSTGV